MNTLEFIAVSLGCTPADCNFIDELLDVRFPSFGDWEDRFIKDFNPKHSLLCNYLIGGLYDEVISHYVELGLDEEKFNAYVDSTCSCLTYDGEMVDEKDLDEIVEQLNTENDD